MDIPIKLQELINKLPSELKVIAEEHVPILLDMADAERSEIFRKLVLGDSAGAYASIVGRMSNEEISDERRRLIIDIKSANKDNAKTVVEIQNMFVKVLNASFLLLLKAAAEE